MWPKRTLIAQLSSRYVGIHFGSTIKIALHTYHVAKIALLERNSSARFYDENWFEKCVAERFSMEFHDFSILKPFPKT